MVADLAFSSSSPDTTLHAWVTSDELELKGVDWMVRASSSVIPSFLKLSCPESEEMAKDKGINSILMGKFAL